MKHKDRSLSTKLKHYIRANYVAESIHYSIVRHRAAKAQILESRAERFIVDEPFNETLYKLIDASGESDVTIYKKAGIDRRHYAKIKNPNYIPQKKTIVAFIFALELSTKDAEKLLASAGFALSSSYLFDVIVRFFLEEKIYDVELINDTLLEYDQALIGF